MQLPEYVNVPDFLKIGFMALIFIWMAGKAMELFAQNGAE